TTRRAAPGPSLLPYTTLFRSGQSMANAPKGSQQQLQNAAGQLAKANQQLGQGAPGQAQQSQQSALQQMQQAMQQMQGAQAANARSEEHTSELQSRGHLVCRLL